MVEDVQAGRVEADRVEADGARAEDDRPRGLLRWLFTDRTTGRIVIGQWPNLTMIVFLAAALAGVFVPRGGRLETAVRVVEYVSLAAWALDELFRGVNPWRRILGAAVIVGGVVMLVRG